MVNKYGNTYSHLQSADGNIIFCDTIDKYLKQLRMDSIKTFHLIHYICSCEFQLIFYSSKENNVCDISIHKIIKTGSC